MMPVAIVLCGCGAYDGSDITEAISLMTALSQAGMTYTCFAPDREQLVVIDHHSGASVKDERNMLAEAARIARGNIHPLTALVPDDFSALAIPGGFGIARNLSTFAQDHNTARLAPDLGSVLQAFIRLRRPLLTLCGATLLLALAAREAGLRGCRFTVGETATQPELAACVTAWGHAVVATPPGKVCIDPKHRLISAPANLHHAATPADILADCQAAIVALRHLLS